MGAVRQMAEPKVRILADVSIETKRKLDEVTEAMGLTKKDFFDKMIDEAHKKYVRNR